MRHRNNFDGLRLLGAGAVLISHQYAVLGLDEPGLGGSTLGRIGVMLFFAISGYLVARSWQHDPHPLRFAAKRFLRVAPALAMLQLLTLLMLRALGIVAFEDNPLRAVNGSLWTIPLEIQCYLLLLAMAMLMRRIGLAMIGLFLFAWASGALAALPWINAHLPYFGIAFGFGVLLHERPRLRRPWPAALMLALGLLAWWLSLPSFGLAMIVATLAVQIGERAWPIWKDAGRHGDLSYGLYLYAFPVQQLYVLWLGPRHPYALMLSLALLTTLALAWLSWRLVERPALALKPKPKPTPPAHADAAATTLPLR